MTGDKRTGPKKYGLAVAGITDELRTNYGRTEQKFVYKLRTKKCVKKKSNKSSKFYWHKINHLGAWRLVTKGQVQKKYGLAVAGITDKLRTNITDTRTDNCFFSLNKF